MFQKEKYTAYHSTEMLAYLRQIPYEVCRQVSYRPEDLMDKFSPDDLSSIDQCYDRKVYHYFCQHGILCQDPREMWARYCHDSSIVTALSQLVGRYDPTKIIGIMGWHALERDSRIFHEIATSAKNLTEKNWLVVSGGGPGAMEAVHFGAYLAGRSQRELEEAWKILKTVSDYRDGKWTATAFEVRQRFPQKANWRSLSVPTWCFGHEPSALFATHCAKLFSNCIREDTLIEISTGGIVFMPGSAGTLQELFQATERNHYLMAEYPRPIIFYGKEHWTKTVPIFPIVQEMLRSRHFKNLLAYIVDDVDQLLRVISDFQELYPMVRAGIQRKKKKADTQA